MTNAWNSLKMSVTITDDTFNDTVSGSQYLGRGKHSNVYIEGIEAVEQETVNGKVPALKIVWSNDDKQSIRQTVYILGKKDDKGTQQLNFGYKNLLSGLISDKALRGQFHALSMDNPGHFASFAGMRADIEIREGYKGYSIKEADTGGMFLYDVKEKKQIGTEFYASFKEAAEAAKGMGLKRAYDEVSFVSAPSDDEYKVRNDATVRSFVETKVKSSVGGGSSLRPVAARSSL